MTTNLVLFANTLAAATTPATEQPAPTPPLSGTAVAIIISLILIALILAIGKKKMWATLAVAFIAFIGLAGVLATTAPIAALQLALTNGLSSAVSSAGGDHTVYLLVIIGLAALGVGTFVSNRGIGTFALLVLLSLPMLAYPTFQGMSVWYINTIGVPLWDGFTAFIGNLNSSQS